MFDPDRFVSECRAALRDERPLPAVRDVAARAVSDPSAVLRALGEPTRGALHVIHRSEDLTILNVIWAPSMMLLPHNHLMWAVIGISAGREDNIFWRRIPGDPGGKVEAVGARALSMGDAVPLGKDVIHSVNNPIPRLTGALHIYGGDFFGVPRSEWDAESLLEGPTDGTKMSQRFDEANARLEKR